jgi:tetratricopeptide (TPR) repeat protein
VDGVFAVSGRSAGTTDALGRYQVQAPLGRVSENFDLGRALNSGLPGLLLGGATNRTKRIDVIQLDMQVSAEGYRPYAGPVSCRRASPERFEVDMEPVLLPKAGSKQFPVVADGWGPVRIESVQVTPELLVAGSDVVVTATLRMPVAGSARETQVTCVSGTWGKQRLTSDGNGANGRLVFQGTLKGRKPRSSQSDRIAVVIERCPLDVAETNAVAGAPMEIVMGEGELPLGRTRLEARKLTDGDDGEAALEKWSAVCRDPAARADDFRRLAQAASTVHQHAIAAEALQRAVELTPERERSATMAEHAMALLRTGNASAVISSYGPMAATRESSARLAATSPLLLAALGESYLRANDLEKARAALDELQKAPGPLPEGVIRFRQHLRRAEAEAKVGHSPDDPEALLGLGRVMLDEGRFEEAMEPIRQALKKDPDNRAAQADLAFASRALQTVPVASDDDLDAAIAAAERQAWIEQGAKPVKSKDFRAWHKLAMLYVRAASLRGDGGLDAAWVDRALAALEDAVRTGRSGARVNEGVYAGPLGFLTARISAVAGFAYPEAAWDYVMMESIRALKTAPNDGFALFNLTAGLLNVGERQAAAPLIAALTRARPGDPEVLFLHAQSASLAGDARAAVDSLRAVLDLSPRHPRARLLLAQRLAELGDVTGAAATLAEHYALYGAPEPREAQDR